VDDIEGGSMRVRLLATACAVAILTFIAPVRAERAVLAGPDLRAAPDLNAAVDTRTGRVAVDPAGDRLVRLGPRGRLSTMAVFPARLLPAPSGARPMLLRPVPSSVVRGPDGAFYVGELTSFPHPPGQARVWRVAPGREPVVHATGLTAVTALAWGADGRLYATQAGSRPGPVRVVPSVREQAEAQAGYPGGRERPPGGPGQLLANVGG
jgi:hypothetical protein